MGEFNALTPEEKEYFRSLNGPEKKTSPPENALTQDEIEYFRSVAEQNSAATLALLDRVLPRSPDRDAEAYRLAKEFGVDVSVIEQDQDRYANLYRARAIRREMLLSPVFARQARDPKFASLTHDDFENAAGIERVLRQVSGGAVEGAGMSVGGIGRLLGITQRGVIDLFSNFLPKPSWASDGEDWRGQIDRRSLYGPMAGEGWEKVGGTLKGAARDNLMIHESLRTFGDDIASGLGQISSQAAMYPVFRGAGIYAQGADMMAEKVAPDIAGQGMKDLAMLLGAVVTGSSEMFAIDKILKAPAVRGHVAAALGRIGVAAASEGAQEFSENVLHEEVRKALTNPDAPIDLGGSAYEGAVGSAVGGIARSIAEAALHVRSRGASAEQSERQERILEEVVKLSQASKLLAHDPEAFGGFVEAAADGTGAETVYVDTQALYRQEGLAERLALASPTAAAQLKEPMADGGFVAVPAAEYMARVAPDAELDAALAPIRTADPEVMTPAERQAFIDGGGEAEMEEALRAAMSDDAGRDAFEQARDWAARDISEKLEATGLYGPGEVAANAAIHAHFFARLGQDLGMEGERFRDFYDSHAGTVVAGGQAGARGIGGEALEQAAKDFDGPLSEMAAALSEGQADNAVFARLAAPDNTAAGRILETTGIDVSGARALSYGSDVLSDLREHPGLTAEDWKAAETILNDFDRAGRSIAQRGMQGERVTLTRDLDNGESYGAVFEAVQNRKHGRRVILKSFVRDRTETVNNWFRSNTREKLTSDPRAGGDSRLPNNANDANAAPTEASGETLPGSAEEFNQSALSGTSLEAETARWQKAAAGFAIGRKGYSAKFATPAVLRAMGERSRDLEMRNAEAVKILVEKHADVPKRVIADLPRLLHDPLFVFPSRDSGITVVLDAVSEKGEPIIAAVRDGRIATVHVVNDTEELGGWDILGRRAEAALNSRDRSRPANAYMKSKEAVEPDTSGMAASSTAALAGSKSLSALFHSKPNVRTKKTLVNALGEDYYQADPGPRGAFDAASRTIRLFSSKDPSTFLHESAHLFLETLTDVSASLSMMPEREMSAGERRVAADMVAIFEWLGVPSLEAWGAMGLEERRPFHEKFARGFERYLYEGFAPSSALRRVFQRISRWLRGVYRNASQLGVEMSPEIRGVFDRMLASEEEVARTRRAYGMMPLFENAEEAGLSAEEFEDYQNAAREADGGAQDALQARALRDMKWIHNARGREILRLKREARAARAQAEMEARREVMSQPVYRAWQFLTGKMSAEDRIGPQPKPARASPRGRADPSVDSLFEAISKLGGLNRAELATYWGLRPEEKADMAPGWKAAIRSDGRGLSIARMEEALIELGYLPDNAGDFFDTNAFEEAFFDELNGKKQYSIAYDIDAAQPTRPGDQVANPAALGAGRLSIGALEEMFPPVGLGEGDRARAEAAAFLQGEPIASVPMDAAPLGQGFRAVREWAAGIFDGWGNRAVSPEVGEVVLNEKSVRDSQGHGQKMNHAKANAFAAVKDVIEKGRVVLTEPAHGRQKTESVYISAPVEIGGAVDIVTVLAHRDMNTQRMYLHSVTTKESLRHRLTSGAGGQDARGRSRKSGEGGISNVLHGLLNFKAAVNESGQGAEHDFVMNPAGTLDYGEVTPEMAALIKRQAAPIRLQHGNSKYGLKHIESRHGEQIRALGFSDAREFIADALRGADSVWQPEKGVQLVAVKSGEKGRSVFIELQQGHDENGDFYTVNTAFPVREGYAEKKGWKRLWGGEPVPAEGAGAPSPFAETAQAETGRRLTMEPSQSSGVTIAQPASIVEVIKSRGMAASNGLHPDIVADMFEFDSGDEMARALAAAPPPEAAIAALAEARMLAEHGEVATPEAIRRAALEALSDEAHRRIANTELRALEALVGRGSDVSRAAKEYAARAVGRMRVRDIRPARFEAAQRRAQRESDRAFRKGDIATAAAQKRNQVLQGELAAAARRAQEEIGKATARFRRMAGSRDTRGRNKDISAAALDMLAAHGILPRDKAREGYLKRVYEYDGELYSMLEPALEAARADARSLADMSLDEARQLRSTVDALWKRARRSMQAVIDGKRVSVDEARDVLKAALAAHGAARPAPGDVPGINRAFTDREREASNLATARAHFRRVEHWCDMMDGGDIMGVFRRYLFNPVSEAATRYRKQSARYRAAFNELLMPIRATLEGGKIAAPEIGYTFGYGNGGNGMAEFLHVVLHTGNASNRRKLLLGRGWADELADGSLDTSRWEAFLSRMASEGKFTKAHMDFAQGVWDLLESAKPAAQRAHHDVYGFYFDEVTADAIQTQWGEYRGGYVPAIQDAEVVRKASERDKKLAFDEGYKGMFPATNKGFTKSRVDDNKPLKLDLRLIPQHLDKVAMFTHMEAPVRDVYRIFNEASMKAALEDAAPQAWEEMILPFLNRAALQKVEFPSQFKPLDRILRAARRNSGVAFMFLNITNAMQQFTGLSIAASKVRPGLLADAFMTYIKDPSGTAERIHGLSDFMSLRMRNEIANAMDGLNGLLLNPSLLQKGQDFGRRHGYVLQQLTQNVVDTITWLGAFNQALEAGHGGGDAVRSADAAVRMTQGSLSPEDVSAVEAGSAGMRLFTQFSTYFNMMGNLLATQWNMPGATWASRATAVFCVLLLPAWLSGLIVMLMRGGAEDEDDDGYLDDFMAFIFGEPLRSVAAMVPVGGQALTHVTMDQWDSKRFNDRLSVAPVVTMVESAGRALPGILRAASGSGSGSARAAVRDTLSAATLLTGVPVAGLSRPLGYMADVAQGRVEPEGALDFARGLATGAASPGSRQR